MIPVANECRLVLTDTNDLNNAACVITCWAGPVNSGDIRIEHVGQSMAFVVDKTWCSRGALKFTAAGTDVCPLGSVYAIPAGVDVCRAAGCKTGPVFTVDQSGNPVKVNVTSPAADTFTVYWGTGYLPTKGQASGTDVTNTYWTPGRYQVRVQDEATGIFGKPVWVFIDRSKIPDTITVTCPADQVNKVGDTVTATVKAAGTNPSVEGYTFTATGLPPGVTLSGVPGFSAKFSGKPTATQAAGPVVVTATDRYGKTGTCTFQWSVTGNTTVTVTKPADQTNAIGDTVNLTVSAVDSDPTITTFTWSATGLPAGLTINTSTGKITGSPTKGQAATNVTVTATDKNSVSGSATFKWTVTTTVTVANIPDLTTPTGVNIPDITVSATDSDSSITSFVWSVSPALPSSLTQSTSTGKISGKVDKAQAAKTYTVTATDALGAAGTKTFKITSTNTVTVATVADQAWTNGTKITDVAPSATDSDSSITTFTWGLDKALPAGVTLDAATGKITGTPSATMTQTTFTLTATDSTGAAGTQTFKITVS